MLVKEVRYSLSANILGCKNRNTPNYGGNLIYKKSKSYLLNV